MNTNPQYGSIVTDEIKGVRALVSEFNLMKLEAQIKKLNRRAVKLRVPELTLNVDRSNVVIRYLDPELGQYGPVRRMFFVSVDGTTPRVDGFQLIAKLEGTEHGNIIKTLIDTDLPEEFRTRITCDHCNTDRYRKDTFIVRDQAGQLKQVGRNCLADYLRSAEYAALLVDLAELRNIFVDCNGSDPDAEPEEQMRRYYAETEYDLMGILVLTAGAIRQHGWVSSKIARESEGEKMSTAERVFVHLSRQRDRAGQLIGQIETNDADKDLAELTLAWINHETSKQNISDYFHNVRLILLAGAVTGKQISIFASTVASYVRYADLQLENARRDCFGTANAYLGSVNAKLTLSARLVKVFNYEIAAYGRRGTQLMATYIFRTAEGNTLTWKTEDRRLPVDFEYQITGTVKKHECYKGTFQTVLTRCKLECEDKALSPVLSYSPARAYHDKPVHHVDGTPLGKDGNMDRAKWIKLFKELTAKHGKPTVNTKDTYYHAVFSWR